MGAMWVMGSNSEIDVFEMIGRSKNNPDAWTKMPMDIECPGTAQTEYELGYLTAGSYHTYGLEWDCTHMKYYADGKLVRTIKKGDGTKVSKACWSEAQHLVLSQETFPWEGIPTQKEIKSQDGT